MLTAQNMQTLDAEFKEARKLASSDQEKSIAKAKDVIQKAEKINYNEIIPKCNYVIGFNYMLKGDTKISMEYGQKAIDFAKKEKNNVGEALGNRLMASNYIKLGMLGKAKIMLDEALSLTKNIDNEEAYEIRGLIYNTELNFIEEESNFKRRLPLAKLCVSEFEKIKKDKALRNNLLTGSYIDLSWCFLDLNQLDSAQFYLRKSGNLLDKQDKYMLMNYYNDYGSLKQKMKNYDSAIYYYNNSLKLLDGLKYDDKKIEIYNNLSQSYYANMNIDKGDLYKLKMLNLKDSVNVQKKKYVDNAVNDIESKRNAEKEKLMVKFTWIISAVFIFITALIVVLILGWIKNRKDKKKYKILVNKLDNASGISEKMVDPPLVEIPNIEVNLTENHLHIDGIKSINISSETEKEILKKLNKFESNLGFNKKEISLNLLASNFDTNSKYLSEIIKKYKNQNFNAYINELRINYLINELRTNPKLLDYKISYLAEMVGYSSYSTFNTVFRQISGISPSSFVKIHKKEINSESDNV